MDLFKKKPKIDAAAIVVGKKTFFGTDHGKAIDEAKAAGKDVSDIDREEDGKFHTTDDRLITRDQAEREFGIRSSEELNLFPSKESKPMIVIVTTDYSGLGWAKLCVDAGYPTLLVYEMKEDEENKQSYDKVGQGIVDKISFSEFWEERNNYKNSYIIWDGNFLP